MRFRIDETGERDRRATERPVVHHHVEQREGAARRVPAPLRVPLHRVPRPRADGARSSRVHHPDIDRPRARQRARDVLRAARDAAAAQEAVDARADRLDLRAQEGGRRPRDASAAASRSSARCSRPSRTSSCVGKRGEGREARHAHRLPLRAARAQGAGVDARVDGADGGARARACTRARSTASTTCAARCCVQGHRALRRVRPGVPRVLQGRPHDALRADRGSCSSWLDGSASALEGLTDEQRDALEELDLEKLRELFEQRLQEQKERHDGGNRWIGTGGTSPFGTRRQNPTGMRVGGGRRAQRDGGRRRAPVQGVPPRRRARRAADRGGAAQPAPARARGRARGARPRRDHRRDRARTPASSRSCSAPPRRNRVKVVLLMDVGGSMDPHAELMSRLFTAATRAGALRGVPHLLLPQLRLQPVYEDAQFRKPRAGRRPARARAIATRSSSIVGDALMHPAELLDPGGSMYLYSRTRASGIEWLRRLAQHFRSARVAQPRARAVLGGHDDRGDRERVRRCGRSRSTASPRRCATSCAAARSRASAIPSSG